MSDHQSETAFLRHCLSYEESPRRLELDEKIAQIQRDQCCVRRAAWLMVVLAALSAVGLGYAAILTDNFPHNTPPFVLKTISALGAGSLISLLIFAILGIAYRRKLDQRREECRLVVQRLLAARLGRSVAASPTGFVRNLGNLMPRSGPGGSSSDGSLPQAQ